MAGIHEALERSSQNSGAARQKHLDIHNPKLQKRLAKQKKEIDKMKKRAAEDRQKAIQKREAALKTAEEEAKRKGAPPGPQIHGVFAVAAHGSLQELEKCMDSINLQDSRGMTPLHHAVLHNNDDNVAFLVSVPYLNINAVDHEGRTSLFLACENLNKIVCRYLVSAGANTSRDGKGRTPFHFFEAKDPGFIAELTDLARDFRVRKHDQLQLQARILNQASAPPPAAPTPAAGPTEAALSNSASEGPPADVSFGIGPEAIQAQLAAASPTGSPSTVFYPMAGNMPLAFLPPLGMPMHPTSGFAPGPFLPPMGLPLPQQQPFPSLPLPFSQPYHHHPVTPALPLGSLSHSNLGGLPPLSLSGSGGPLSLSNSGRSSTIFGSSHHSFDISGELCKLCASSVEGRQAAGLSTSAFVAQLSAAIKPLVPLVKEAALRSDSPALQQLQQDLVTCVLHMRSGNDQSAPVALNQPFLTALDQHLLAMVFSLARLTATPWSPSSASFARLSASLTPFLATIRASASWHGGAPAAGNASKTATLLSRSLELASSAVGSPNWQGELFDATQRVTFATVELFLGQGQPSFTELIQVLSPEITAGLQLLVKTMKEIESALVQPPPGPQCSPDARRMAFQWVSKAIQKMTMMSAALALLSPQMDSCIAGLATLTRKLFLSTLLDAHDLAALSQLRSTVSQSCSILHARHPQPEIQPITDAFCSALSVLEACVLQRLFLATDHSLLAPQCIVTLSQLFLLSAVLLIS